MKSFIILCFQTYINMRPSLGGMIRGGERKDSYFHGIVLLYLTSSTKLFEQSISYLHLRSSKGNERRKSRGRFSYLRRSKRVLWNIQIWLQQGEFWASCRTHGVQCVTLWRCYKRSFGRVCREVETQRIPNWNTFMIIQHAFCHFCI